MGAIFKKGASFYLMCFAFCKWLTRAAEPFHNEAISRSLAVSRGAPQKQAAGGQKVHHWHSVPGFGKLSLCCTSTVPSPHGCSGTKLHSLIKLLDVFGLKKSEKSQLDFCTEDDFLLQMYILHYQ